MVNIYIEFYIFINKKMIWDYLKFNRFSFVVNIQENEICDYCEIYYDLRVMSFLLGGRVLYEVDYVYVCVG